MTRTATVSSLCLLWLCLLAPLPCQAQTTSAADELARLQAVVDDYGKQPDDPALQAQVYRLSGAFLDRYGDRLPDRHLTWIGSLWFQLAGQRGDEAAAAERARHLRQRDDLPVFLEQAIARYEARQKIKPGQVLTAWNAVDVFSDRYAPVLPAGRLVLVHFWASWCPPCRRLMQQQLRPLVDELGDVFSLVSVGVEGPRETAETQAAFARRHGYRWTFLHDEGGDCAEALGVQAHPTLFLVDAERRVLLCGPGWEVIEQVRAQLEARRDARAAESSQTDTPDTPATIE